MINLYRDVCVFSDRYYIFGLYIRSNRIAKTREFTYTLMKMNELLNKNHNKIKITRRLD